MQWRQNQIGPSRVLMVLATVPNPLLTDKRGNEAAKSGRLQPDLLTLPIRIQVSSLCHMPVIVINFSFAPSGKRRWRFPARCCWSIPHASSVTLTFTP